MAYYVKHTFIKTNPKPNVLKEQGWFARYRGPFKSKEDAEAYLKPFQDKYGKRSKFQVIELTDAQRNACPSAYDLAYEFRTPEMMKQLKVNLNRGLSKRSFKTT